MLTNGTATVIENETLDGYAAVAVRETPSNEARQSAEEIWKKAMDSVLPIQNENVNPLNTVNTFNSTIETNNEVAVVETPVETFTSETIRTKTALGRLRRVSLTEVWKGDLSAFADWVQNSIDLLAEALNLPLHENSDGSVALAQNAIIECQLGDSHNESLGKLLLEVADSNAKLAVWVVEKPRAEHIRIVNWLNQSLNARIFLAKVDAVRIEESVPAPFYTPIVSPDNK